MAAPARRLPLPPTGSARVAGSQMSGRQPGPHELLLGAVVPRGSTAIRGSDHSTRKPATGGQVNATSTARSPSPAADTSGAPPPAPPPAGHRRTAARSPRSPAAPSRRRTHPQRARLRGAESSSRSLATTIATISGHNTRPASPSTTPAACAGAESPVPRRQNSWKECDDDATSCDLAGPVAVLALLLAAVVAGSSGANTNASAHPPCPLPVFGPGRRITRGWIRRDSVRT